MKKENGKRYSVTSDSPISIQPIHSQIRTFNLKLGLVKATIG